MNQPFLRSATPGTSEPEAHVLLFGTFRLEPVNEQFWRRDERVVLQPLTFQVLRYLVERPQRLVSKQELLAALWSDVCVTDSVLKAQINEIRRHLEDSSRTPRFIETVHRRGYRFIAAVKRQLLAPPQQGSALPSDAELVLPMAAGIFVGRDDELSRLQNLWEDARRGQRRQVFVTGEPGIGKTTLVSKFIDARKASTPFWLAWGQCVDQYGQGEAYLPFLEAFGRLCRTAEAAQAVEVLRRKAPTWWTQISESVEPVSVSGPGTHNGAVPPERMLREMADAIPALTQNTPLLIVLEDLHWADHSTLSLISYLAQRSDFARLFILGTYRSRDVRSSDHPLWSLLQLLESRRHGEELALRHLDDVEVRGYLAARFPQSQFPVELPRELCLLTAGNPLFLCRVVDVLLERGLIQRQGERWQFLGAMSNLTQAVPDRLVLLIAGETERLTASERSVLEAASVAGVEFSVASVAAALDRDIVELEELCARWVREGRFFKLAAQRRNAGLRCEFCHTLYRQALYQRLTPTRRMQLHLRLGLYEEALPQSHPQASAGLLAMHFRLGEDPERATRYGLSASEHALRCSAYQEAIAHLRTALDTLDGIADAARRGSMELELLVALSVPLVVTLGYAAPEVESVYLRARTLCEQFGGVQQSIHVLGGMTTFYLVRGQMSMAKKTAESCLALAEAQDDPDLLFDAHLAIGLASYFLGELAIADSYLRPALDSRPKEKHLSRASAFHPSPYLLALCYSAQLSWMLGYPDRALEQASEALALARQCLDRFTLGCVLAHLGCFHKYRRDESFFERVEEFVDLGHSDEFRFYGLFALHHQGVAAVRKGDPQGGMDIMMRAWGAFRAAGIGIREPCHHIDMAEACIKAGRLDQAFRELQAALDASRRGSERCFLPEIYRIYGDVCLASPEGTERVPLSGDAGYLTPESAFSEALARAREKGSKVLELRAAVSLGRVWLTQGRFAEARRLVREVYDSFTEGHGTADLQRAKELLHELGPGSAL